MLVLAVALAGLVGLSTVAYLGFRAPPISGAPPADRKSVV